MLQIVLSVLVTSFAFSKCGEVCIPIHQSKSESENTPGPKGDQGEPGPPGECACDFSEVSRLEESLQEFQETITYMSEIITLLNRTTDFYCVPNPCMHEGACLTSNTGFICHCRDGYDGTVCSKDVRCSVPKLPIGVAVSATQESVAFNESITYTCKRGYKMIEQEENELTALCQKHRDWSSPPPGCEVSHCTIGMEDGRVQDHQITASSTLSAEGYYAPEHARLNLNSSTAKGWAPQTPFQKDEWLQVDLEDIFKVTGIKTQGYPGGGNKYYLARYKIAYGITEDQMQFIRHANGKPKIFKGDSEDVDIPITNGFYPPITARFIRLYTELWIYGPYLRLEYLTCRL